MINDVLKFTPAPDSKIIITCSAAELEDFAIATIKTGYNLRLSFPENQCYIEAFSTLDNVVDKMLLAYGYDESELKDILNYITIFLDKIRIE